MTDHINFDKPTAEALRKAYEQALADNKEVFEFRGKSVLTTYAKYVCEYLVTQGLLK